MSIIFCHSPSIHTILVTLASTVAQCGAHSGSHKLFCIHSFKFLTALPLVLILWPQDHTYNIMIVMTWQNVALGSAYIFICCYWFICHYYRRLDMCLSDPLYLPPPSFLVNIYWYVDKRGITSSVTGNLLQSIGILRILPHMLIILRY